MLQFSTAEECPELTKNRLLCRWLSPVMSFVSAQGVTATGFTRMAAQAAKIKRLFIDNKVPRAERDKKLLVTAGSKVLWIIGERQAGWKTRPDGKWLVMRLAGRKDEKMNENIAKILLSEEEIQKRVKELGRQIHDDYKDKEKL